MTTAPDEVGHRLTTRSCFVSASRGSLLATRVRTSAGGLGLRTGGRDPILFTWPDVASTGVRRSGSRTLFEVTPVEMSRVHRVEVRHGLPRVRDGAFVADVGLLRPGIAVLRREPATWGATK